MRLCCLGEFVGAGGLDADGILFTGREVTEQNQRCMKILETAG